MAGDMNPTDYLGYLRTRVAILEIRCYWMGAVILILLAALAGLLAHVVRMHL